MWGCSAGVGTRWGMSVNSNTDRETNQTDLNVGCGSSWNQLWDRASLAFILLSGS